MEREGFSIWWDQTLRSGEAYDEVTEQALESAKAVVVLWSPRSVVSRWVRAEATVAGRNNTLIPVMIEPCKRPIMFELTQTAELSHWQGDRGDPAWRAFVSDVGGFVGKATALAIDLPAQMISTLPGKDTLGVSQKGSAPLVHAAALVGSRISRRATIAGGIGALAVAGVGGWAFFKPSSASASTRIAVMSFSNMSGDPDQAYFSDGIAEELRGALSRIGMQVIGKASCDAAKDLAIPAAATKLGVANILTGSVRRSPETIRVGAQLVNGEDGVEKWAQDYDRAPGDTIKIQTDIATHVAGALSIALGTAKRAALTLGGTADAKAQDLILECRKLGRELFSADSLHQRIALADAAIRLDPNYAEAYVEKAAALTTLAIAFSETAKLDSQLAEGEAAARKAIAIAPSLGSPHGVLAYNALGHLDFRGALQETKLALALSPNDSGVLGGASRNLALLGSPKEAMQAADRGISLDPLNSQQYETKTQMLFNLRRYPQAIEAAQTALRLAPRKQNIHLHLGDAFLQLDKPNQAKTEYDMIGADSPYHVLRLALLAARTGDHTGAERLTAQFKQRVDVTLNYQLAEIYAQLGDNDRAFAELGEAVRAKDSGLAHLRVDPFLDPIRGDARFTALLKRLSFPA